MLEDNSKYVVVNPPNIWKEAGEDFDKFVEILVGTTLCEYFCTQTQRDLTEDEIKLWDDGKRVIMPEGEVKFSYALCCDMGILERMLGADCPCHKLAIEILECWT